MNYTIKLIIAIIIATLGIMGYIKWHHGISKDKQALFKTEQISKQTINPIFHNTCPHC